MSEKKTPKMHSLFSKVMLPLFVLAVLETGMLAATLAYLYSGNSPFQEERRVLLLALALVLMLVIGIAGSIFISRRIAAPIQKLSLEVEQSRRENGIPHLSVTGIREIDQFAGAITSLSRDVVNSSTRFLQIIQLASAELGGFELRFDAHTVYVTENFFRMLGIKGVDKERLTIDEFQKIRERVKEQCHFDTERDGGILYKVLREDGTVRYIRVNEMNLEQCLVGVAEDVTSATVERLRMEQERDYDVLTDLLNRRAFYAQAEDLFANPQRLGFAAVMMLDLDNLKYVNDHYGHDSGDKYIRQAANHFAQSAPSQTLCSRVSGDEFFLLFYGFCHEAELNQAVDQFSKNLCSSEFLLPSGESLRISASGGIARYPQDSTDFRQLMKYADFAMYQVKHGQKGSVGEFDLGVYNQENFRMSIRREFYQLLREERIFYHFQPIVDNRTGGVRAYEALMRTDLPTIHSPAMILKIAREEKRLQDIENLTWIKAPACFQELLEKNLAEPDALLFINSIADQAMTDGTQERHYREYHMLQARIVKEITESEELELVPKFAKVDMAIIRDIDKDPDKQQIVADIVSYAHKRGMEVVAEGIETMAELRKVLELDVDLLQGYLLARPAAKPDRVPEQVLKVIQEYRNFRAQQKQWECLMRKE